MITPPLRRGAGSRPLRPRDAISLTSPLTILAIVDRPAVAELFRRVFDSASERLLLSKDLGEGLALAASEKPHVAFVDVSMGRNAGLALVHHIRAVAPSTAVYAMADVSTLAVAAQAAALGGAGLIVMPPSGDELKTAASEARAKLSAADQRARLERDAAVARRGTEIAGRVAALAECPDRPTAAKKLVAIFSELTGASEAAVYLFAGEDSSELVLSGSHGIIPSAPTFADEMGLMTFARQHGCELVALCVQKLAQGHVLLSGLAPTWGGSERLAADLVAGQATMVLALLAERERSTRGAMKDQTTSAYTFAYFVDIAGREIDKARRYGRRFALATITIDDCVGDANQLAEAVLGAVRDTDVLARVDDREFYLLMPETGGVGAQSCRRRVLQAGATHAGLAGGWTALSGITMGIASYPHDGVDLSRLLRAAKRRADVSRQSVVRSLRLERLALPDIVDDLIIRSAELQAAEAGSGSPRPVTLSHREALSVGLTAVGEALRAGTALVVVAHQPEYGLSPSLRAHLGPDREGLSLHVLDVRAVPRCADLQLLTVISEHGAYALAGRTDSAGFRGVHGSDPLFVDLITLRAGQAVGVRLLE